MTLSIQLFVPYDTVRALELALVKTAGAGQCPIWVALAWYLRQSSPTRSADLARQAQRALDAASAARSADNQSLKARLALLSAETALLQARLAEAEALATQALHAFAALGDATGQGDAQWCIAHVLLDRGDYPACGQHFDQAQALYEAANDRERLQLLQARRLFRTALKQPQQAQQTIESHFDTDAGLSHAVLTWVEGARAMVSTLTGAPGRALVQLQRAYDHAQASGQLRQAIHSVTNQGVAFVALGDRDSALECFERGMALAIDTGWPGIIGVSRMQTGSVLSELGRYDEAGFQLREALKIISALGRSRSYALCLSYLAELDLALKQAPSALQTLAELEQLAQSIDDTAELVSAHCGQARALSLLGRGEEAWQCACRALGLAESQQLKPQQLQVLRVCAELHRHHTLPPPQPLQAACAELHFLLQMQAVAEQIEGYQMPAEVLEEIASAHAHAGDFEAAYRTASLAGKARESTAVIAAQHRAIALEVRQQSQRQRELARMERERANLLLEANATLERLGAIGQSITANLDESAICAALNRHASELLDTQGFGIYLLQASSQTLESRLLVQDGEVLPPDSMALSDPHRLAAQCAREAQEILQDGSTSGLDSVQGLASSQLFAPLRVNQRVLGVMGVQSKRPGAYQSRELSIFRTLCAYGAIALDNANAYRQLAASLAELRRDECSAQAHPGMGGPSHEELTRE